jgi:hypothetical protein
MRVVFTGTTGVRKLTLMQTVASFAARESGKSRNLSHPETQAFIRVLDLDNEIDKTLGGMRKAFLDMILNPEKRDETWYKVFEKKVRELENYDGCVFLGMHNWCYRKGQFFSCVNWDLLRAFRPTVFITLFDDVYDIWQRVNDYERQMVKTNSFFRLNEILEWRSAEILATDILAKNLFVNSESHRTLKEFENLPKQLRDVLGQPIPHFTIAVKHPLSTFYRLLFRRVDYPIVYASFPITDTRDSEATRRPIDEFRKKLHENFTTIDPLTIDEFRFKVVPRKKRITFKTVLRPRWPATPSGLDSCLAETPLTDNPFEGADNSYLDGLKEAIAQRVVSRDLRLVAQAAVTVGFRPFYGGQSQISRGMDKEIITANDLGKGLYIFHPDEDEKGQSESIFASLRVANPIKFKELIDLDVELDKYKTLHRRQFEEDGIRNTWERQD